MNALELFVTRRSTRAFRDAPIEQEKLDQILEAGRHAPSGGNNQTTHLLVIRDKAVLAELAKLVKEEFAKMEVTEGMYKSNRADYSNNIADCACVLENMMVMANALDLGSCWINQLKWLNENEPVTAYLRTLGLAQGERVYGAVSIGYAKTEDGLPSRKPLPRTGNPVTFI